MEYNGIVITGVKSDYSLLPFSRYLNTNHSNPFKETDQIGRPMIISHVPNSY